MRKKLLILDIDSTILYAKPTETTTGESFRVTKRPFLDEFMDYVISAYDVGLWTAGTHLYAKAIVNKVLYKYSKKLKFVWSLEDCERNETTGDITKPLSKIWRSKMGVSHGWNMTNTLMVEDTPENCWKTPENVIAVPKFTGNLKDLVLVHLKNFLMRVQKAKDFSQFSKTNWLAYEKNKYKATTKKNQQPPAQKSSDNNTILGIGAIFIVGIFVVLAGFTS